MNDFKEFPTQEEYDDNPEYFADFKRRQQKFRDKIMSFTNEAGDKNELDWLEGQIVKLRHLENKTMRFFVDKGDEIPEWQTLEVFYCVDQYRDMIAEMIDIYNKRRSGR